MIQQLSDLEGLSEHVKSCGLPFREAVIDYYKSLGEKLGFTARASSTVIKYGINFGKADLVWVEPNIIFFMEFGSMEDVLKHLWKTVEAKPENAVFILSSVSQCKPEQVKKIVENSDVLDDMRERVVLLDVSGKKVVYP